MAKSSRRTGRSPSAWLTAAEQGVLDSTVGTALATATRNQLLAAMKRARTLRDKWRDLFKRQSLAAKQGSARTNDPANTRSLEKSELFGAAVKRLEARIDELAAGASAAIGGSKPAPKRPAARPAAAAAKPAKAGTSKKQRRAGKLKALAASGTGQAVQFDPKKQRSAKARATAARIKLDGLSTRRRGHTLASGKRKQARRDGR